MNEISGQEGLEQVTIPHSDPFIMIKEEWSLVELDTINMIRGAEFLVEQEETRSYWMQRLC